MSRNQHGLIFDMDGVIADTERINAIAGAAAFKELFGLEGVTRDDFEAGIGRGAEAYMRAAAEVHGLELPDDDAGKVIDLRQDKIMQMLRDEPLPAYPGVLELMTAALGSAEWCVAIATGSTAEKTMAVLKSARVPYDRMVCVTDSDVKVKKPDPTIFMEAAKRLGVAPADCVIIEDSVSGVKAAGAAGAKCVAVTNSFPAEKLAAADMVVDSLIELSLDSLATLVNGREPADHAD